MKTIAIAIAIAIAVLSLNPTPAQAKDTKPQNVRGEVVLCKTSKVQVWEDGTATCQDQRPDKVGKWWNGFRVGSYIRCQKQKNIETDQYDKRGEWAHCDEYFPPCENEDGSGNSTPCIWDAKARGNHRGASFVLSRDEITYYLAHAHAAPKDRDKLWFTCKDGYKAKSSSKDGYPSVRCTKVKK